MVYSQKHVDTAKEVLETIGKMQRESMQDDQEGSLDDTVSAYKSFLRVFWEQLKLVKICNKTNNKRQCLQNYSIDSYSIHTVCLV